MEVTKEEFKQTDQNKLEIIHGKEFDKDTQFESIDKEKASVLRFGEIVEALMRKYVEKAHESSVLWQRETDSLSIKDGKICTL